MTLTPISLPAIYGEYIDCLNRQDFADLARFVHSNVAYNGELIGLPGYRAMLEKDFREIPDLRFDVGLLVCEPPIIACRLNFDCSPKGRFLGLAVDGRRVTFSENVFYRFAGRQIETVWSIIDKTAIEAQLR